MARDPNIQPHPAIRDAFGVKPGRGEFARVARCLGLDRSNYLRALDRSVSSCLLIAPSLQHGLRRHGFDLWLGASGAVGVSRSKLEPRTRGAWLFDPITDEEASEVVTLTRAELLEALRGCPDQAHALVWPDGQRYR